MVMLVRVVQCGTAQEGQECQEEEELTDDDVVAEDPAQASGLPESERIWATAGPAVAEGVGAPGQVAEALVVETPNHEKSHGNGPALSSPTPCP